jgi:hypothetical protein
MKEPWAWNRSQSNFSCWQASLSSGKWSEVHLGMSYQNPTGVGHCYPDLGEGSLAYDRFHHNWWWDSLSVTSRSFILYSLKIKIASDLWINHLLVSRVEVAVLHFAKQLSPKLKLFFMGGSIPCLWLESEAWADWAVRTIPRMCQLYPWPS